MTNQLSSVGTIFSIISYLVVSFPLTGRADTHLVQLSGQLETSCSFTTRREGSLVFTPEESPRVISSEGAGLSALVDVNCNTPADLEIFDPEQTGGPTVETKEERAWLRFQGNRVHSDEEKTLRIPPGERQVEIDLDVESLNPLEAGTYIYTVRITATP